MSDDPSAARGGELGCVLKGKMPKPFEDAASALAPGKVSDVIATETGFYLVKLDQIAKDAEAEKLGRAQTARELYVAPRGRAPRRRGREEGRRRRQGRQIPQGRARRSTSPS